MPKQSELFYRFQVLTGYRQADIAKKYGFSRQMISAELRNYSLTHKAAVAHYLTTMIDEKITEQEKLIGELQFLKTQIAEDVIRNRKPTKN